MLAMSQWRDFIFQASKDKIHHNVSRETLKHIALYVIMKHLKQKGVSMKKIEFETLAVVGALESVVIFESVPGEGYELWAYPLSSACESNRFKTAKGETRIWASLDVLVKFIRSMGYSGSVKLKTTP